MYKILIKYPPEYNTPLRIEERENLEEALGLADEVEQGWGSCMVFNKEEWKEFLKLSKDE